MNKSVAIQPPKKILIIRLSSIGDVLLTTPVIRHLKNAFPNSQVDYVIKKDLAELLQHHSGISQLYRFEKSADENSLKKIKQEIKHKQYDLIVDLHKNFRSYYLTSGCGAKDIVRYKKGVFQRFLLVKFKLNFYRKIIPIFQRYLNCIEPYDGSFDGKGLDVYFDQETEQRIFEKYSRYLNTKDELIIGIAPGAKHGTKRWTAEGFSSVINFLIKNKNARIILFGSRLDREIVKSFSIEKPQFVLNTTGGLSLLETTALMNHCDLVLTNDSGLMHLASALKKKVVAIFGSTTEQLGFFPYLTEHIVIQNKNLKCRPCSHIGRKKCPRRHFKCMKEITAEQVISAMQELLKTNRKFET